MSHIPGTDLCVSRLGLGSYNSAGVFGPTRAQDFIRLMQVALDMGITFFDTAPSYGEGEIWLGRALRPVRSQAVISTKFLLPEPLTTPVKSTIVSACEESLRRLATDYIDLYHLHYDAETIPQEELIEALETLRATGKIRYYGLSHVSAKRFETYLELGRFSTLMLELHPLAPPALARLRQKASSLALVGYSVTGRGLLTGRFNRHVTLTPGDIRHHDPLFQRENLIAGHRIVNYLMELGRYLEKTPAQLVIAWALAQPGVAAVLTTTGSEAHLRENIEGAHYQWPVGAWAEFTAFLSRVLEETRRLREETVAHLLSHPLQQDAGTARCDLIYLIESLYADELVPAHRLVPLYFQLQRAMDSHELERVFRQLQRLESQTA